MTMPSLVNGIYNWDILTCSSFNFSTLLAEESYIAKALYAVGIAVELANTYSRPR